MRCPCKSFEPTFERSNISCLEAQDAGRRLDLGLNCAVKMRPWRGEKKPTPHNDNCESYENEPSTCALSVHERPTLLHGEVRHLLLENPAVEDAMCCKSNQRKAQNEIMFVLKGKTEDLPCFESTTEAKAW